MRKKKNNALLIALLIVAAMSGSAFAADAVSGSSSLLDETIVLIPQELGGESLPETNLVVPQENATEQQTPIVSTSETATQPAIESQEPAEAGQSVVEEQPEGTTTAETPITEPEAAVPTEEPVVTEPAITEEEVVTEPAVVVAPETVTLTITHRLIVGDGYLDDVQIVEGLTLGEVIDLQPYKITEDWLKPASDISTITLSESQTSILLEYKPVEGFVVVIPEEIPNDMPDM